MHFSSVAILSFHGPWRYLSAWGEVKCWTFASCPSLALQMRRGTRDLSTVSPKKLCNSVNSFEGTSWSPSVRRHSAARKTMQGQTYNVKTPGHSFHLLPSVPNKYTDQSQSVYVRNCDAQKMASEAEDATSRFCLRIGPQKSMCHPQLKS